jgi:hypothetical protein
MHHCHEATTIPNVFPNHRPVGDYVVFHSWHTAKHNVPTWLFRQANHSMDILESVLFFITAKHAGETKAPVVTANSSAVRVEVLSFLTRFSP